MLRLKTKVSVEDRGARIRLQNMERRVNDARPVFELMATEIAVKNAANYTSHGSLVGGWKPLDPQYQKTKISRWGTKPTMVASGRLASKVTKRPFGYEKIGKTSMTIGTKLPYAKYHRTGTKHMPRRDYMVFNRSMVRKYKRIMKRYIAKGAI